MAAGKWKNLKGTYTKEREWARVSGAGAAEVPEPTWVWWKFFKFLDQSTEVVQ